MNSSFNNIIRASELAAVPTREACETLGQISTVAPNIGLTDAEIAEALGKPHDTLSARGIYWRMQAFLLRYLSPLGVVILTTLGIVSLLHIVKQWGSSIYRKLYSFIKVAEATIKSQMSPTGLLEVLVPQPSQDGAVNDDSIKADALILGLTSSLPMPIGIIASQMAGVLEDLPIGGSSGSATPAAASPLRVPSLPSYVTAAAAPQGTTLANVLSNPVVANTAGAIAGAVGKWVGGLFSDEESADDAVRDAVRDEEEGSVYDRTTKAAEVVAKAALSLGVPPAALQQAVDNVLAVRDESVEQIAARNTSSWDGE